MRSPTSFLPRSSSISGWWWTRSLSGLLHRRNASPSFGQQPTHFSPAPILQRVLGSRCSAYCPLSPISFLEVASGRGFSSCVSTRLGIGWTSQSGFLGLQSASGIFSGGSTCPVCLTGCLWLRCLRIWTFGPTPQTWVGEPIWVLSPLQAFGMQSKPLCPSTLGSCWPSGRVSSTSALLWSRRMWRYFATTPQQCLISARRGAQGRRSSTPWLRGFSVGRSPSPSGCYPSSFRGP